MYIACNESSHLVSGEHISHYHLLNLTESLQEYNKQCYLKIDVNSELDNRTEYVYSNAVSVVGGLGALFISILGTFLNVIVIAALIKDVALRKEYLTPPILSLATTDLLYSMCTLPAMAIRYFVKYVFSFQFS